MTVHKRNGRWNYRRRGVRLPDGRRVGISGVPAMWGLPNTKVGAEAAEARHVAHAMATGELRPPGYGGVSVELEALPEPAAPTLRSFAPTFLGASATKNKFRTVDSKRQILDDHILPALGYLAMGAVTYAVIEDFKIDLLTRVGGKTANNVLTVLRRLLAVACKRGLIASVPEIEWLRVERPDFDFLDFEESDRLVAAADREWSGMIHVARRTGLRQGELLGLRWEDVDLDAGRIVVRQAIVRGRVTTPKNHKPREIALSPSTVAALKAERHLRGPLVWCDADGHALTAGACKHPLYRACRRAGLRRIGWHVLRHTFASHLVMREVSLNVVRDLMGHATIAMTLRYAHLAPSVPREAVARLDQPWHMVSRPARNGPNQADTGRLDGK